MRGKPKEEPESNPPPDLTTPAQQGQPEPWLLTVEQVAALLQISESITYRLVARGELPSIKIGRAIRIVPDSLKRWITEREQAQQEEQQRIREQLYPSQYRQSR